jgi:hypothetical protein
MAHNPLMSEVGTPISSVAVRVAVVMERTAVGGRWGGERWEAKDAVLEVPSEASEPREIFRDESSVRILFPGLVVSLRRSEAEGYYLNLTSPEPRLFVLWRMQDGVARPELLTVSYNEGARWMDGGENVDGVALPPQLLPWIAAFVAEHYRPEPKKPKRYASSKDKGVASKRDGY